MKQSTYAYIYYISNSYINQNNVWCGNKDTVTLSFLITQEKQMNMLKKSFCIPKTQIVWHKP